VLLALAAPAMAEQGPGVYSVTGVAADDVLNIRAEPSADAPVVGSYAPDRSYIEVLALSPDGRWGQVGLPEGNGWVAMRYLVGHAAGETAIPRPFRCVGTEPFWTITFGDGTADYASPEGSTALSVGAEAAAADGVLATLTEGSGGTWTVIASRGQCSDGMSDRIYGWTGVVFRQTTAGNALLQGCCTADGG